MQKTSRSRAFDYVFGYTIVNDVSARNLQTGHKQWYFGKGLDALRHGTLYRDEGGLSPAPAQAIRTWVNGQLRQERSPIS